MTVEQRLAWVHPGLIAAVWLQLAPKEFMSAGAKVIMGSFF